MTLTEGGPRTGVGIGFVDDLARHGTATAVIDVDGTPWSYTRLREHADAAAAQLGPTRRLVLLEAANDLETIAWYLGALRGGHAVLLTASDDRSSSLVEVYDPDVVVGRVGDRASLVERRRGSAHELHPDLALLLSTSGSTGSPKLVRLSQANLDANARAVAASLRLRPDDRAISSLPLQYCYGLSVLHSHLSVGATVVCTSASVVDPCFWGAVDQHGVTNLAGVPHTFDLLDRSGFPDRRHPSLRLLTQAGGRMDPSAVRSWAELGAVAGFELVVMYGQTEATARMAYLPPELAATCPDAVGVPVPGGSFRLEAVDGAAPDEGELVYAGPNVMLGYATSPGDLAAGATLDELRTGDLARIDGDGLVRIVGRRRPFVKLFGLRIDLGRVAALLDEHGITADVDGDDEGVALALPAGADAPAARRLVVEHTSLPFGAVAAAVVEDLPRLPNGKVDQVALRALVRAAVTGPTTPTAADGPVTALLGRLLGSTPRPDDTFVSLGGDSLTYVEASIALEERLGHLPDAWHLRPVGELDRLGAAPAARSRIARVDTGVVLRAVSIVLIVASHTGTFLVGGGAHVLFAASGFNVARFQLRSGSWGRSLARVAVPSIAWIGAVAALTEDFDLAHGLLLHGWIGGRGRWAYWFVEVLVQALVVLAVAFRVPAIRRFERRHPVALPALLLVPALAVRFDVIALGEHHRPFFRPHEIAWVFLLGWLAASARSTAQRAAVTAVAATSTVGFFGDGRREAVLFLGLLLLVWVPTLPLPRFASRLIGPLASASLYIYLTHVQVHPLVSDRWPLLGLLLSLVVGVAVWAAVQPVQRRIEHAAARRRAGRPVPRMAGSTTWSPDT
ncbi:MAG TPA: AMP-binding protein [Acidimicrobiales bacterium]|nr:AMP-binding protein [Acidimicrobiales bacterium]